jgi:thiol-disulfide isomerase/thioredoxin
MNCRLLVGALLGGLLSLTACSSLDGTNDNGYISGDGTVVQFDVEDRGDPVEGVSGTTLDGDEFDLESTRGTVTVVNVWWSGCGPCNAEMPLLVEAEQELGDTAEFVGINTRDPSVESARSFQEARGVDYPSIFAQDGKALLPFGSKAQTMPSTVVLDREGRIAALVPGAIPSQLTLVQVVEAIAAEGSTDG